MPAFAMGENSALAEDNLSGSRQQDLARFGKTWSTWLGEKMVEEGMTRRRGCETVGGQNIRELKEQVGDTLGSGEERCLERRR